MSQKVTIGADIVHVVFSDDPIDNIDTCEIVADYDLEGNPVGFEAFDFKSPPWGGTTRLDTVQLAASFIPEDNALTVWFEKNQNSSDQEVLDAEFGFSKDGMLVFAKYAYLRGGAARKHRDAK